MASFARELLTIDRQRLDFRAGVLGLAVLSARLVETVLGVVIAFVVLGLTEAVAYGRSSAA
ncbi:MAG TPA: hypothetical protein VMT43_00690 [Acidimicrobiales bacterium]|nr:hypothetical protein [Acidimicrobiales bacterium]